MLTYEYLCKENGQSLTVRHGMTEEVKNWGELCHLAGIEPGKTSPESPVERLIFGGTLAIRSGKDHPLTGSDIRSTNDECTRAPCCGAGGCSHKG